MLQLIMGNSNGNDNDTSYDISCVISNNNSDHNYSNSNINTVIKANNNNSKYNNNNKSYVVAIHITSISSYRIENSNKRNPSWNHNNLKTSET